jgi:DnaJ-class molecular chaperone
LLKVGEGESRSHPIFSSQYINEHQREHRTDDLVIDVECRLSELFNGCKKTLVYNKEVLTPDGQSVKTVSETKTIEIDAGRSSRRPIVF